MKHENVDRHHVDDELFNILFICLEKETVYFSPTPTQITTTATATAEAAAIFYQVNDDENSTKLLHGTTNKCE